MIDRNSALGILDRVMSDPVFVRETEGMTERTIGRVCYGEDDERWNRMLINFQRLTLMDLSMLLSHDG